MDYAERELVAFLTEEDLRKKIFRNSYKGNGITVDYSKAFNRHYDERGNYSNLIIGPCILYVVISAESKETGRTFIVKFDRWVKKISKDYDVKNI